MVFLRAYCLAFREEWHTETNFARCSFVFVFGKSRDLSNVDFLVSLSVYFKTPVVYTTIIYFLYSVANELACDVESYSLNARS